MPLVVVDRMGLIPAHAGSTEKFKAGIEWISAHPRSRGEHCAVIKSAWVRAGSSPLTRGAREARLKEAEAGRLIPAHAGSTGPGIPPEPYSAAHPRSRGEHATPIFPGSTRKGSSPLTRGALNVIRDDSTNRGLIPAHAGSTA